MKGIPMKSMMILVSENTTLYFPLACCMYVGMLRVCGNVSTMVYKRPDNNDLFLFFSSSSVGSRD